MLFKKYPKQTAIFILLSIIYLTQTVLVAPDKAALAKYHLSSGQAKLIGLTFALPYLAIWFIALLSYLRLNTYADLIKKSKDGLGFSILASGVMWLAFCLPLSVVFTNFTTHTYMVHPDLISPMVRVANYFNLLVIAPGFILIYQGSSKLVALAKTRRRTPNTPLVLAYIAFAALYTFSVLHDPVRLLPNKNTIAASYYQTDWLIISTLVIPRLILWFLGLMAIENLYLFRMNIKGSLYKIAIHWFAVGIGGVAASSIILRGLQSFTPQLSRLSLGLVLMLLYAILLILGTSYWTLSKGAKKLLFIEKLQ